MRLEKGSEVRSGVDRGKGPMVEKLGAELGNLGTELTKVVVKKNLRTLKFMRVGQRLVIV